MIRGWMVAALLFYSVTLCRASLPASPVGGEKLAQAPGVKTAATTGDKAAQASDPLVELLQTSAEPKIRARSARDMGKDGDPSFVPALTHALADASVQVRREVVIAFAQIRVPTALDALVSATRDTTPEVRVLAVKSVVGYYTGITPSAGFTGFVKKEYRRVKSHFVADSLRVDPGVSIEPKVVNALVQAMNDTSSIQAAREAAKGLGILMTRTAVPALVEKAHSTDEDLALESLNALAKIKDVTAGPKLMDLLDSSSKEVRRAAAVTVGILRTREALPKLQAMFENDSDRKAREYALEGLAYLGDPVSVPLFIQALWSRDKAIRTSAAEGLGRARDQKAASEVEKALTAEKDAGVKLADKFALTALGRTDYLAAVVHELSSREHNDAAEAYLRELARDPQFLPQLYPFLSEHDATVRAGLCTVLMFTGNQTSLEPLERLSRDPNNDVASQALRAMRAIRARAASPGQA